MTPSFQDIDFFTLSNRLFIISILSAISIGCQNYYFAASAASLTGKLRSLSFRAILRQDSAYSFFFHPSRLSDGIFCVSL